MNKKDDFYRIGAYVMYENEMMRVTDHTVTQEHWAEIIHTLKDVNGYFHHVPGRSLVNAATVNAHAHTHTESCQKRLDNNARWRKEFAEAHPNHCPLCEGRAGTHYPSTHDDPGGTEPCYLCYENGFCPFCGADIGESEICDKCGWTVDWDGMPEQEECTCWEEREEWT